MSLDTVRIVDRNPRIEWPTLALIAAIYGLWLGLTWYHALVPLWLWLPLAAWTGAWWGSAQHEILHGHPTRSRAVNAIIAAQPMLMLERRAYPEEQEHEAELLATLILERVGGISASGAQRRRSAPNDPVVRLEAILDGGSMRSRD